MLKRKIKNKLVTGIIVTLPILLSIYFIIWIFKFTISILNLLNIVSQEDKLTTNIIVVLSFIVLFFFIGMLASSKIGKRIINKLDLFIYKIPIFKSFYVFFKQLIETIYFKRIKAYKKVVIVEYPQKNNFALGFITSETPGIIDNTLGVDCFNVFIPTTPNPTSGLLIMFPKNEIRNLDMSVEEAIKYVVSGGLASNKYNTGGNNEY